jgi:hypothetical protein
MRQRDIQRYIEQIVECDQQNHHTGASVYSDRARSGSYDEVEKRTGPIHYALGFVCLIIIVCYTENVLESLHKAIRERSYSEILQDDDDHHHCIHHCFQLTTQSKIRSESRPQKALKCKRGNPAQMGTIQQTHDKEHRHQASAPRAHQLG